MHKNISLIIAMIVALLAVPAEAAEINSYMKEFRTCVGALRDIITPASCKTFPHGHSCQTDEYTGEVILSKWAFTTSPEIKALKSGKGEMPEGCSEEVLQDAIEILSDAYDCAKSAVNLRNHFQKANGRPEVTNRISEEISTLVIGNPQSYAGIGNGMNFTPVAKSGSPEKSSPVSDVEAGKWLYFHNDKCPDKKFFAGHVMTVLENETQDGKSGVWVFEGHLNDRLPEIRWLTLKEIANNEIPDISCCVFKGVVTPPDPGMRAPGVFDGDGVTTPVRNFDHTTPSF